MKKSITFNGVLKIIGNVVMIIAIVFIVKRLLSYDIDYSFIVQGNNLWIFIGLIIAYAVSVIITSIPWKNMVYLITSEKIRFIEVATVSTKANVMKYIPGNVFQYIGRNELAVEKGLAHKEVAFSTLFDVAINLGSVFLVTLIFSYDTIVDWLNQKMGISLSVIAVILVIVGCLAVGVFAFLLKKKRLPLVERIVSKKGCITVVGNIGLYVVLSLYTTWIYIHVLQMVSGGIFQRDAYWLVAGAVLASWIIGFVTPGAPGGMGVRESMLLIMLGGIMSEEAILLGVVINRVVSILGDLLALFIMQIVYKVRRMRKSE